MNSLFTLLISFFIPGIGQIILKDYTKGFTILALLILLPYLILNLDFLNIIPVYIPFIFLMIWAVFDVFDKIEKIEGRKSAIRKMVFSILIMIIIIPATIFMLFKGLLLGGEYINNEYYSEDRTKKEMSEISFQLEKYRNHTGDYPENYILFISQKPIWTKWKTDSWNEQYKYERIDSINYKLISSGKDGIFDNDDDLMISNQ